MAPYENRKVRLSIVTTLYNSADTVEEFHKRAVLSAKAVVDEFEIIMVNDGSLDNSLEIACRLAESDPCLKVVELSRNFGHHKAMMTGLEYASGDRVFLIDSDLEEAPEVLKGFFRKLEAEKVDVVYGYQKSRKGGIIERITGGISYWMMDLLVPHRVPRNHLTVRMMERDYVQSLLLHREHQAIIGGLWIITGYRQLGIPVDKGSRSGTTYSLQRRWCILLDSITNFSETPLVAIFYLGMAIFGLSGAVGLVLILLKIFRGIELQGWVSVMLSVWFLGGLMIFCLGIIAIYISKVFIETKNRPYTIVRRVYGDSPANSVPIGESNQIPKVGPLHPRDGAIDV